MGNKNVHYLSVSLILFAFFISLDLRAQDTPSPGSIHVAPPPPSPLSTGPIPGAGNALGNATEELGPRPYLEAWSNGGGSHSANPDSATEGSRSVSGSRDGTPGRDGSTARQDPCHYFYDSGMWKLDDLDYMGVRFNGRILHCINNVRSDAEARRAPRGEGQCPNTVGRIVNPANPQYFSAADGQRLEAMAASYGDGTQMDRDRNPFGFYFCMSNSTRTKPQTCNRDIILAESRWPDEIKQGLDYRWQPTGDGDGNCECRARGTNDAYQVCSRPEEIVRQAEPCQANGLVPDTRQNRATAGEVMCQCSAQDPRYFPASQAVASCQQPPTPEPPTEPSPSLKACVDGWKARAQSCTEKSRTAQIACQAADTQNAPSNQSANALTSAGGFFTQVNAGTGAQNECFKASLVTNAGSAVIRQRQDNCNGEYNACVTECGNNRPEVYARECSGLIQADNPLDQQYFNTNQPQINASFTAGDNICSGEVRQGQSAIDTALRGVGDALSQSTRCMCQLSSSAANCNSIPTVATCATNPDAAGCSLYSAISVCTPGPSYNAAACNCEMNPTSAGCRTTSSGALSNFASSAIKAAAAEAAGVSGIIAASGGGAPGGGVDLGTQADAASGDLSDAETGGAADGRLPVVGGAGGELAAGGAGSVSGDGTEADGEGKGLAGLLNSAKTFMARALKGKSSENGNAKNGKGSPDMNGFRPRGIASNRDGVGSKNQDIWKMMNSCVQGETCKANQGNYITAP